MRILQKNTNLGECLFHFYNVLHMLESILSQQKRKSQETVDVFLKEKYIYTNKSPLNADISQKQIIEKEQF